MAGNKPIKPKFSIVIPSYNQVEFIERTLVSVLSQKHPNVECIVVDAGSTDGTIDIIKKYEKYFSHLIIEPDEGQSDALNKGFIRAEGDILTWVNSDDILLPNALYVVSDVLKKKPDIQWVAGNSVWIDAKDKIIHCSRLPKYNSLLASMGLLVAGGPSTFFSKKIFEEVGGFRKELHFNMDTDLWWRIRNSGVYFHRLEDYLMGFRYHAASKCSASSFLDKNNYNASKVLLSEKRKNDEIRILNERYGSSVMLPLAKVLYKLMQIANGNYIKLWLDLRLMKDHTWQSTFKFTNSC